jgi:acetyl-CoA carboxylase carboxyltransferase component
MVMVKQLLRLCRIDGWAVGIVANQRSKNQKAKCSLVVSSIQIVQTKPLALLPIVIRKNPLVFCSGCYRFYGGSKSEQGGIIKDGAKWLMQ